MFDLGKLRVFPLGRITNERLQRRTRGIQREPLRVFWTGKTFTVLKGATLTTVPRVELLDQYRDAVILVFLT